MEGSYFHRPLEEQESIRTFVLQPSTDLTDPLVGHLEECSFGQEDASYIALSYSWAMEDDKYILDINREVAVDYQDRVRHAPPSSTTKVLSLENINVLIGENLHDALWRLREKSELPLRLWVDAICIDQDNEREKSSQVTMMGSIYANAERVVAWLGEGNERDNTAAHLAFRCLLAEQAERAVNPRYRHWYFRHRWSDHQYFGEDGIPPDCSICTWRSFCTALHQASPIKALYETCIGWRRSGNKARRDRRLSPSGPVSSLEALFLLFSRRYFQRLWIMQEVSIPHADRITFQFGAYTLHGNPLTLMDQYMPELNRGRVYYDADGTISMYPPAENESLHHSSRQFVDWVAICSLKHCSDPRDKIYGILAMAPNSGIQPDYSLSPITLYHQFARQLFSQRFIITLLSSSWGRQKYIWHAAEIQGDFRESLDGLPTWVPNLGFRFIFMDGDKELSAAMWQYIQPGLSDDGLVLSCHFCYLGTVISEQTSASIDAAVSWEEHESFDHSDQNTVMKLITNQRIATVDLLGRVNENRYGANARRGDVICCLSPEYPEYNWYWSLILRPDNKPGQWRINGHWVRMDYVDSEHKPNERRLYHVL